MKRREFIAVLGSAAVSWPRSAITQQAERMRHIGVLMLLAEDDPGSKPRITMLLQGFQQLNWIVDQNIKIDIRWGAADAARARKDAAELVALTPDARSNFLEQLQPFPAHLVFSIGKTSDVTSWSRQARYVTSANWIDDIDEYDWYRAGRFLQCCCGGTGNG